MVRRRSDASKRKPEGSEAKPASPSQPRRPISSESTNRSDQTVETDEPDPWGINPNYPPSGTPKSEFPEAMTRHHGATQSHGDATKIDIDGALSPGDTLTVTMGAETFSPVQYHPFTVGPFTATTTIRPGETASDASIRVYDLLSVLFRHEFDMKAREHNDRSHEAAALAGNMARTKRGR